MLGGGAEPGGDQELADLVAVQAGGMGLVVQPRHADVHGRGMVEQFLLDRVLVEPGGRAQPASNRGPGPPGGFEVGAEALDVRAADAEQPHLVTRAPGRELAQIQGIGFADQAAVPGQEPG